MIKRLLTFLLVSLAMIACQSESSIEQIGDSVDSSANQKPTPPDLTVDLDSVQKRGVLRAITTYSPTSYFIYKGQLMGFEYEMLSRFAEYLNVDLEIIVAKDVSHLMDSLVFGKADMIAHGLTMTNERKQEVDFTNYLYLTKQVLVQRKPEGWHKMSWNALEKSLIHDPIELIGDTVSVRANSSYAARVINLSDELGGEIYIDTVDGVLTTDEIIQQVVDGDIKYTVADDNIAKVMANYHHDLNIDVQMSFSQRIAWAVRKSSPELRSALNNWIDQAKDDVDYYVIYNKYFKNKRAFKKRQESKYLSLNDGKISKYDDLIKTYAAKIGWDWRLVAALIYQESRFKPNNHSWAGAKGLMQMMPATAKSLGVTNRADPEQSIKGGTKYLQQLYDDLGDVPDSIQRIKFTMASYNCGFYHVKDARALAKKKGLNENVWDENVDGVLLSMNKPANYNDPVVKYGYVRGKEPYNYVSEIFERYFHYAKFIKE